MNSIICNGKKNVPVDVIGINKKLWTTIQGYRTDELSIYSRKYIYIYDIDIRVHFSHNCTIYWDSIAVAIYRSWNDRNLY